MHISIFVRIDMGGNVAKSVSETVTSAVVNVIVDNMQQCATSLKQNQEISVKGDGNTIDNVNQTQQSALSVTCMSDAKTLSDMQTQISNSIMQQLSQQGVAGLSILGRDRAEQTSTIKNEVAATFTQNNVQKCFLTLAQDQSIKVDGSTNKLSNLAQSQTLTATMNCVSKLIGQMTQTTQAINETDQKNDQKQTNPLDFIANAVGGVTNAIAMVLGFIVFVIILVVVLLFGGGGGGGGYAGPPQIMPITVMSPYGPYGMAR